MAELGRWSSFGADVRSRLKEFPKRVPTAWYLGLFTGVILIATAGVGGLDTVQEPETPRLAPGTEHVSKQLSLTLTRAVLIDSFPEAGARAGDDQRVLSIVVEAENLWNEPLPTAGSFSVSEALRIDALGQDLPPEAVARYDDATYAPWLQPGVPVTLVVSWLVPSEEFRDGQHIAMTIRDSELFTGGSITTGNRWIDPAPAAFTTVILTDIGTGADASEGTGEVGGAA